MEEETKVEVSKSQLDELIAQNKELLDRNRQLADAVEKQQDAPEKVDLSAPKKRTVRILFMDGKAVQGFRNRGTDTRPEYVYEDMDPKNPKERILFVDVYFYGEKEPETVPYNDMLHNGIREECEILDTKEKEWSNRHGMTVRKVVNNYATEETGVMVPLEVLGKTRTFTVKLPGGEEMAVHENYVNM